MTPGRVAVIGDLAGHLDELTAALVDLGADPRTHRLPPDLTVIQVGDLVHRGPDSPGVIAFVDKLIKSQPEQWVQLAGNHEAQYLTEPAFQWPERLPDAAADTLRRWWQTGAMRVGAAITTPTQDWLVTHAGLTHGFWEELDRPGRAADAATALNRLIKVAPALVFRPGCRLGDNPVSYAAGPIWAAAGEELVASWLAVGAAPFGQVHGHSSLMNWRRKAFLATKDIEAVTVIDERRRHTITSLPDRRSIIGIDPGHARSPSRPWAPLVLHEATVAW